MVVIRDKRDCVTECNLTSIVVQPDWTLLTDLLTSPTQSLPALLSAADQNTLGQVISSVSQQMNEQNGQQDVPVGETAIAVGSLLDASPASVNGVRDIDGSKSFDSPLSL